jgi:hypothetical protein
MEPQDLPPVQKGATPGEWLALSMDHKRILGRGENVFAAQKAAAEAGYDQIVLFCLPEPGVGAAVPGYA